MTTDAPTALRLDRMPGEQDWRTIRDTALAGLTRRSGAIWTDQNPSDPGITLLETVAYSIADLHHRVSAWADDLDTWAVRSGRGTGDEERAWFAPPVAADAAGALRVWRCAQALATRLDVLVATVDVSQSRRDAVAEAIIAAGPIADPDGGAARPLTWDEAVLVVTRLRLGVVHVVAYDLADELDAAVAGCEDAGLVPRSADEAAYVRRVLDVGALWDEEIGALCAMARHRRRVGDAEALRSFGAATAGPVMPTAARPEHSETADGETLVWPPRAEQVLTCEPVTGADIAALARSVEGVRRAWVVPLVLEGLDWSGRSTGPVPPGGRAELGASTLVVEPSVALPAGPTSTTVVRFLRRVLYETIAGTPPAAADLDRPFGGDTPVERFRSHDDPGPRRVLSEVLGVARLGTTPVTITATIHTAASAAAAGITAEIERRLAAYLAGGRARSSSAAASRGTATEWSGPWPPVPPQPPGWEPGEDIPLMELQRVVHDVADVLGVSRLGTTPPCSADGMIPVADGTVPVLAQLCVQMVVERERGCRDR